MIEKTVKQSLLTVNGVLKAIEESLTKGGKARVDLKILNEQSWEVGTVMSFSGKKISYKVNDVVSLPVNPVVNGNRISYFLIEDK